MDSLIAAAARALAAGDPLGALKRVALPRRRACARAARHRDGAARRSRSSEGAPATCCACLRSEKRRWPARGASSRRPRSRSSRATWAGLRRRSTQRGRRSKAHGDRCQRRAMRGISRSGRLLLIGRLDEAERTLAELDPAPFPPASRTAHELVVAGIALRRLRTKAARAALARPRVQPGPHVFLR